MDRTIDQGELAGRPSDEGLRFARRMYLPRTLGLALGAVCIGGALWQQGAPPLVWAALMVNTLVWPHIAYPLAGHSRSPYRAELRNLMVDSASGGAWVAVIGLNLVPSAVLISMLATMLEAIASLPLLIAYPITVGFTTYRLARRVRQQNQLLAALSSTDGLSKLLNRSHWEGVVASEFQRCRRIGHPSAVMMIDIDHFKAINDRHGHPVGDEVIRAVAGILRDTLRLHDVPGRYGGEEFGVVLPGTDGRGAEAIAERIRARIESAVLEAHNGVRATVSIGVAAFDPRSADYAEWMAHADRALYRAKETGRNRAVRHVPAQAPSSA